MNVAFVVSRRALHQVATAAALSEGLERHGDHGVICYADAQVPPGVDAICVWSWRRGIPWRERGHDVLVMERAYVEDRFAWVSLGWNGLNGRAGWPAVDDGGARWRKHFASLMRPWRWESQSPQGYALVLGQVPTDTAVRGVNFGQWAVETSNALLAKGWAVRFRPHPRAPYVRCAPAVAVPSTGPLEADFQGAAFAVTYNSNSGVDAVMAGLPAVTCDPGSMAWDVTSHDLNAPIVMPDRTKWAARLAWRQWMEKELEDGSAWEAVRSARPGSRH